MPTEKCGKCLGLSINIRNISQHSYLRKGETSKILNYGHVVVQPKDEDDNSTVKHFTMFRAVAIIIGQISTKQKKHHNVELVFHPYQKIQDHTS